jgi:ABC-2 type transport system permease protein
VSLAGLRADFSLARVAALCLRQVYLLRSSWPRTLEMMYFPAVQMVTWGFLQHYIGQTSGVAALAAGTLIGAMLLWDILFRAQLGFSMSFLEEVWARNLGNLLMSPLKPAEFVAGLMAMSLIRLLVGMVPVTLLAIAFFGFNLWSLGLALAAFFANLILTSWTVGLVVSGLVLRHGLGAESLAWTVMFVLLPFACVYYPVSQLPGWLQPLSWLLPPTYVFEGMRALLIDGVFRADLIAWALALNVLAITAGVGVFLLMMRRAREAGSLLQTGE